MNTGLFIFDTKERELKEICAKNGFEVQIYCCGPTVYRDAHVGNLRTFLLGDLVTRTLGFSGVAANLIQNITDVGHMGEDFDGNEIGDFGLMVFVEIVGQSHQENGQNNKQSRKCR